MTDLSGWNTKRRKKEPLRKKTSPGTSSITKSPSNLVRLPTDHEQLKCSPRRSNRMIKRIQEQCITSTPVKASPFLPGLARRCSNKMQRISDTESSDNKSNPRKRKRSQKSRQLPIRQSCIESNSSHSQSKHSSKTKTDAQEHFREQSQRCRPRLNLDISSSGEQDESLPSSDLSIELSLHEEPQARDSFPEDEESQEEEDLPSFLMAETKSSTITEGGFVWYKLRKFPFWPALVKSVNRKMKRASIMIVDDKLIKQKRGFLVALKSLKPYECEEFKEFICKAKEKYDVAIQWSIDLIQDYIMRKGIGSFSGSFLEYCAHDISYPVRRKYQANAERLTFANDVVMEGSLPAEVLEDSFNELQEEDMKHLKRLLPDRTHAAHNRANEKLVQFIVKQGMVDEHLVALMCGQQPSKWLRLFFSARKRGRRVVNIYLEDDDQLDQVYRYLSKLYTKAAETDACSEKLISIDRVPFILDVLLPEALIHAIAGVDNISLVKAEEKYLEGRRLSNRERQEFDFMIEQQMK